MHEGTYYKGLYVNHKPEFRQGAIKINLGKKLSVSKLKPLLTVQLQLDHLLHIGG